MTGFTAADTPLTGRAPTDPHSLRARLHDARASAQDAKGAADDLGLTQTASAIENAVSALESALEELGDAVVPPRPVVQSAEANGTTITVTFDRQLQAVASLGTQGWSLVTGGLAEITGAEVTEAGVVELTLSAGLSFATTPTLSFDGDVSAMQSLRGAKARPFRTVDIIDVS